MKCGCPHGCARDCDAEARCPFCWNGGAGCPILFHIPTSAADHSGKTSEDSVTVRGGNPQGMAPTESGLVAGLVTIPWKFAKTYRDAPHEYILTHQSPPLFNWFLQKLKTESRAEKFTLRGRTAIYRYYYPGDGYKYWIIQNVLNRAKEVPDPDPQGQLGL